MSRLVRRRLLSKTLLTDNPFKVPPEFVSVNRSRTPRRGKTKTMFNRRPRRSAKKKEKIQIFTRDETESCPDRIMRPESEQKIAKSAGWHGERGEEGKKKLQGRRHRAKRKRLFSNFCESLRPSVQFLGPVPRHKIFEMFFKGSLDTNCLINQNNAHGRHG